MMARIPHSFSFSFILVAGVATPLIAEERRLHSERLGELPRRNLLLATRVRDLDFLPTVYTLAYGQELWVVTEGSQTNAFTVIAFISSPVKSILNTRVRVSLPALTRGRTWSLFTLRPPEVGSV